MKRDFPRAVVDYDGLAGEDMMALHAMTPPAGMPFHITKIGHVVLKVTDLERSTEFYTKVMGFRVSDAYPESMLPGRMVLMRFNSDHHGLAIMGGATQPPTGKEIHHRAFQVETLDEVFRARNHLIANGVEIDFEGRRRGGCQVAVEFRDPDGHCLEIYWGLDQVADGDNARPADEWRPVASLEAAVDDAPPGQDMTLADPSLRRS